MSRTLSITAAIVLAALLSVQVARLVVPEAADVPSPGAAAAAAAEPAMIDRTANAIEDLAAWPIAAGR